MKGVQVAVGIRLQCDQLSPFETFRDLRPVRVVSVRSIL